MANNKSWKELMELQGAAGGTSQQKANAMLELIEGRQPFQYNAATDPAAQAVRKETARNIARTTKDTLGSYAGMTGGMPSTAAVSAAAQAGNLAGAQGADKIAELEQLARTAYNTEGDQMRQYWSMLQGQADSEYQRGWNEQQWAYQKEQDKYQQDLALAQLAASYGDTSKLKALGINVSTGGGYTSDGSYRRRSDDSGDDRRDDQGGGLDGATINDLRYQYGYDLPGSVYDQLVAQHGADAVAAAGFRRKKAAAGHSGNAGGTAQKENPSGGGNNRGNRMDMML